MVVDGVWASIVLFLALVSNMNTVGWRREAYYLITVLMFGLMVVRRRWPGPTTVAAMLLGLMQVLANIDPDASSLGYLVFVYTGAAFAVPWISRFALVSGLLAGPLTVGMLHKTSDDGSPVHGFLQQAFVAALLSTPSSSAGPGAASPGSAAPTWWSWRTARRGWSANATPRPRWRWPPSAPGSPANCTTWSPTTSR